MKHKIKTQRWKVTLLILAVAVPLLSSVGDRVLCISPDLDHFSVESRHQKPHPSMHGHSVAQEKNAFSKECGHGHCMDIPLIRNFFATLAKAGDFAKKYDANKNTAETAASYFESVNQVSSSLSKQLIRIASLPETSAHFLFVLVRVVVLLN